MEKAIKEQQDLSEKIEREFEDAFEIKDENKRLKQSIDKVRSETNQASDQQESVKSKISTL